jgi:hypothetical protein
MQIVERSEREIAEFLNDFFQALRQEYPEAAYQGGLLSIANKLDENAAEAIRDMWDYIE